VDDLSFAIGKDVQRAVEVTQTDGAKRHLLDEAA
jgi:hypothetical protein